MPIARWGVSSSDVDDFDRESQFKPYAGPIPPSNQVYHWVVKVLKYAARTRTKNPQLRVGLELIPREGADWVDEQKYEGYFLMAFLPVTPKTTFRYVPFLDAIGVTGSEFENRTKVDEDGNITRIGSWRMDGTQIVAAQLRDGEDENGDPRKEIGMIMEAIEYDDEGDLEEEEEYAEDDD